MNQQPLTTGGKALNIRTSESFKTVRFGRP
uniref:Uncharacterized protein n=1 Tax=Zea mays TaxID=4577 RepID=C4J7D0_MAIZE|nr:unknown [Zea mays]